MRLLLLSERETRFLDYINLFFIKLEGIYPLSPKELLNKEISEQKKSGIIYVIVIVIVIVIGNAYA